jgi:hypothetical protein
VVVLAVDDDGFADFNFEARLGADRLHGSGKDADPLLVLTEAACERYGLPAALSQAERLAGRLAEGEPVGIDGTPHSRDVGRLENHQYKKGHQPEDKHHALDQISIGNGKQPAEYGLDNHNGCRDGDGHLQFERR